MSDSRPRHDPITSGALMDGLDSNLPSLRPLWTTDPHIPPSDGRCLLLKMPREVRDMIYEYTFTEPDGLFYNRGSERPFFAGSEKNEVDRDQLSKDSRAVSVECNQLKYTCRQIYAETKDLEFRYNPNLTFSATKRSSMKDFVGFLDGCSNAALRSIRQVTILELEHDHMLDICQCGESDPDYNRTRSMFHLGRFLKIRQYCYTYDKMQVALELLEFSEEGGRYMYDSIVPNWKVLETLQRDLPICADITRKPWLRDEVDLYIKQICKRIQDDRPIIPPNLHIRPRDRTIEPWVGRSIFDFGGDPRENFRHLQRWYETGFLG